MQNVKKSQARTDRKNKTKKKQKKKQKAEWAAVKDCDQMLASLQDTMAQMNTSVTRKGKGKVQGVPQSKAAALPRHQEEEETDKTKRAQIKQTYGNWTLKQAYSSTSRKHAYIIFIPLNPTFI